MKGRVVVGILEPDMYDPVERLASDVGKLETGYCGTAVEAAPAATREAGGEGGAAAKPSSGQREWHAGRQQPFHRRACHQVCQLSPRAVPDN